MQKFFNPIDYAFSWTADWYKWDSAEAHRQARTARDVAARYLIASGRRVKRFTLRDQLVRRGGIGTRHPDVEFFVTAYGINVD